MIILLAGLQSIPDELYEAARIDGAGAWAQFRHVTLPALAPIMLVVSILTIAGYFQLFAEPYVMTQGGPVERSEEHTSELQSLMRISYAVFCLKKKHKRHTSNTQKPLPKHQPPQSKH